MGTIAEKLAYLRGTKEAIKQAINAKNVSVPDDTAFREYADKIFEIGGGFRGYTRTRTSGTMPSDGEVVVMRDADQLMFDDTFAVAILLLNGYSSHYTPMVLANPSSGQYVTSSGAIISKDFDSLVRGSNPGGSSLFPQDWYWSVDPYGMWVGKPYTLDVYVYHG